MIPWRLWLVLAVFVLLPSKSKSDDNDEQSSLIDIDPEEEEAEDEDDDNDEESSWGNRGDRGDSVDRGESVDRVQSIHRGDSVDRGDSVNRGDSVGRGESANRRESVDSGESGDDVETVTKIARRNDSSNVASVATNDTMYDVLQLPPSPENLVIATDTTKAAKSQLLTTKFQLITTKLMTTKTTSTKAPITTATAATTKTFRTPMTFTKRRPLECYACYYHFNHTHETKACLDPANHRKGLPGVHLVTCEDVDDSCYTSVLPGPQVVHDMVYRGCRADCINTPDTMCCRSNRCNNQGFPIPIPMKPRLIKVPYKVTVRNRNNKGNSQLPSNIFYFISSLLLLQTVFRVYFVYR